MVFSELKNVEQRSVDKTYCLVSLLLQLAISEISKNIVNNRLAD